MTILRSLGFVTIFFFVGVVAVADESAELERLAKAAQNPIANMISLPIQNNTSFEFGPEEKTQNVMNIQPVVPFSISDDWNLITRTILPVVSQPELLPGQDREKPGF